MAAASSFKIRGMSLGAGLVCVSALTVPPLRFKRRSFAFPLIRAAKEDNSNSLLKLKEDDDDARYVLKLGVGSMAGAAVIKYGSVIVPEVTTPNLLEALFIIATPVIVAAMILLLISRSKTEETSP